MASPSSCPSAARHRAASARQGGTFHRDTLYRADRVPRSIAGDVSETAADRWLDP
jgi:hypothetical protein